MNAVEAVIVVIGSLMVATAMIAVIVRINESERRTMERRREEWIAGGVCRKRSRTSSAAD